MVHPSPNLWVLKIPSENAIRYILYRQNNVIYYSPSNTHIQEYLNLKLGGNHNKILPEIFKTIPHAPRGL